MYAGKNVPPGDSDWSCYSGIHCNVIQSTCDRKPLCYSNIPVQVEWDQAPSY